MLYYARNRNRGRLARIGIVCRKRVPHKYQITPEAMPPSCATSPPSGDGAQCDRTGSVAGNTRSSQPGVPQRRGGAPRASDDLKKRELFYRPREVQVVPETSRVDKVVSPAAGRGVHPYHDPVLEIPGKPAEVIHLPGIEFTQFCSTRHRQARAQGTDQERPALFHPDKVDRDGRF